MEKLLDIALWGVVAIAILIFVASIMVGHATDYRFLSSLAEDQTMVVTNVNILTSKLSSLI